MTTGETLDHKIVSSISIGREAISSHQIAFRASFSDGSSGIYVATVEPESESDQAIDGMGRGFYSPNQP